MESEYVDESIVDQQEMTYGAINGMLSSLDDANTRFSDPVDAVHVEEHIRGSFEGIGVRVELRDGRVTVVAPLEGSPGERAGLRGGDVITHVNGEDITQHSLNEAVRLIRGPRGTKVTLTIERQGQPPFDVEIERAEIKIRSVRGEMVGDIAYLKINTFNANAPDQFNSTMQELLAQEPVGLILDLRNNPGGLLSSAVHVTSQFLSSGVVLREEPERRGSSSVRGAIRRHCDRNTDGSLGEQWQRQRLRDRGRGSTRHRARRPHRRKDLWQGYCPDDQPSQRRLHTTPHDRPAGQRPRTASSKK